MAETRKTKGLLLCVCQGTCPAFANANIFEVANALRHEKLVDWVGIHPQLCADDGDAYLHMILRGAEDLDQLFIGACDPVMQRKMFREAMAAAGFDQARAIGIDIRNQTTEQMIEALKSAIAASGTPAGEG